MEVLIANENISPLIIAYLSKTMITHTYAHTHIQKKTIPVSSYWELSDIKKHCLQTILFTFSHLQTVPLTAQKNMATKGTSMNFMMNVLIVFDN